MRDRHIYIIILWVWLTLWETDTSTCYHLVRSKDTSTCYHLVRSTDTSTCYHLVSSNMSTVLFDRHIDVPSSCEFDQHIDMLSHVAKNCAILHLPNEDFGRMNKRWNPDVRSTFQWCEYSIWATNRWKLHRKSTFHLLFILPKSSFGEHKFRTHYLPSLSGGCEIAQFLFAIPTLLTHVHASRVNARACQPC